MPSSCVSQATRPGGYEGRKENMVNTVKESNYNFVLTEDQKDTICRHFGKNREDLEDWEISELLDKIIDNLDY